MGEYLYLLRSPKLAREIVVEKPDGTTETVRAASLAFLCKPPLWPSRRYQALEAAQHARVEQLWGDKRPCFGVHTEAFDESSRDFTPRDPRRFRIEVGQSVYHWPTYDGKDNRPVPVMVTDGAGSIGTLYGVVKEVVSPI